MKRLPLHLGLAAIAIVGVASSAAAQIDVNGLLAATAEAEQAQLLSGQCLAAIHANGTAASADSSCQQFVTYWDTTIIPNSATYEAIATSCDTRQLPAAECSAYANTLNAAAATFAQLSELLN